MCSIIHHLQILSMYPPCTHVGSSSASPMDSSPLNETPYVPQHVHTRKRPIVVVTEALAANTREVTMAMNEIRAAAIITT